MYPNSEFFLIRIFPYLETFHAVLQISKIGYKKILTKDVLMLHENQVLS